MGGKITLEFSSVIAGHFVKFPQGYLVESTKSQHCLKSRELLRKPNKLGWWRKVWCVVINNSTINQDWQQHISWKGPTSTVSRLNFEFGVLVCVGDRNPGNLEKDPRWKVKTNNELTNVWCQVQESSCWELKVLTTASSSLPPEQDNNCLILSFLAFDLVYLGARWLWETDAFGWWSWCISV